MPERELPRRTDKPWGYELLWAHADVYVGKLIFVKKGHRLSLQYHRQKDETLYVHEGRAVFEVTGSDGKTVKHDALPGFRIHFAPLTRHRIAAVEDTVLFEVSTTELDDVVRVEDDYGRRD